TLAVIKKMEVDGIIGRFAISVAIAAYNYIEAAVTEDLDILVSFDDIGKQGSKGLITLVPIYSYLKASGFEEHRKEGVMVGGWPVQFLPVADSLDEEALAQAAEVEIKVDEADEAISAPVLRPEHLVNGVARRSAKGFHSHQSIS